MRKVKIGTVSFLVEDTPHSIEMNIERGCDYIREASSLGCDIICLPEMFRTLQVPGGELNAESVPGATSDRIADEARTGSINVIAPYYVESEGIIFNQATVFD